MALPVEAVAQQALSLAFLRDEVEQAQVEAPSVLAGLGFARRALQ
jgi:hypothetical protein